MLTMDFARSEMFDAIHADQHVVAPEVVGLDDAGGLQRLKERAAGLPQRGGRHRSQRRAHLRIARHGVNPIEVFQVAVFRLGAFIERKQRRTLQREHREGTAQHVRQRITGVRAAMVADVGKFRLDRLH